MVADNRDCEDRLVSSSHSNSLGDGRQVMEPALSLLTPL